jgi:hypothetical protein
MNVELLQRSNSPMAPRKAPNSPRQAGHASCQVVRATGVDRGLKWHSAAHACSQGVFPSKALQHATPKEQTLDDSL